MMKIAVIGLWHLGTVTAACLAKLQLNIIAYDSNPKIIEDLQQKKPPVFEPGLIEILATHDITYSSEPQTLTDADIAWVTFDTPVNDQDVADAEWVKQEINRIIPYLHIDYCS